MCSEFGIVVGDVLPVHGARAQRDAPERHHIFHPVGGDLAFIGCHHLGDRRPVAGQTDEDEAVIDLALHRLEAVLRRIETDERVAERDAHEAAAQIVAPGVIAAVQPHRAVAGRAVDQPRGAMPAHIVERAHDAVVAADDDDRLVEEIEGVIVARIGNIVQMTHDLPPRPEHALGLVREEFLVVIEPARQADEFIRVRIGGGELLVGRQGFVHHSCSIGRPMT